MTTEETQELASLYALGALSEPERSVFQAELRMIEALRVLVRRYSGSSSLLASTLPQKAPSPGLKNRILAMIASTPQSAAPSAPSASGAGSPGVTHLEGQAGLWFRMAAESSGWKELPVRGAWIKLLSFEPERGYAVLMGKLDPGVRYPSHANAGPEDFFILSGDLHIGTQELRAGDFHHAEAGSQHGENHSVEGCTLLAVLTSKDPLVAYAMAG